MRGADSEGRSEANERPPKQAVKIQNQARPSVRDRMHVFEDLLDVGSEVQCFREDDEIERALERELFASHDVECPMGQPGAGGRDLFLRKVYADDIAIRQ